MIKIATKKLQLAGYVSPSEDVVLTTPQTLSAEQKQQARDNIGVSEAIKVDDTLSLDSTNPLQNKAVKEALDSKSDTDHTHTADEVGAYSKEHVDENLAAKADLASVIDTIDNLPLSGKNYIFDTDNETVTLTMTNGVAKLNHTTLYSATTSTHTHLYSDYNVSVGDQLSFSVIIQPSDAKCYLRVDYYAEDGTTETHKGNPIAAGGNSRSVLTLPVIEGYVGFNVYIGSDSTSTMTVGYRCLKVERGNRPTEWNDYWIRWDRAQSLSDSAKAQARANIGAGTSSGTTSSGGITREFNHAPSNTTTTSYTTTSGNAKLYLVEISNNVTVSNKTITYRATVMVDWNMRSYEPTYYVYLGPDAVACALTLAASGNMNVKFTVSSTDSDTNPYISRVIGYY